MAEVIFPEYYPGFACKAERCSDNCCIGWEIDIDGATLEKYESMSGELGDMIRRGISYEGAPHFEMIGGRCPMLRADNLCAIIAKCGEGGLCHICHEHPRFYNELGDLTLGGVGMSCEAAAELILLQKSPSVIGDLRENKGITCCEDSYMARIVAECLYEIELLLRGGADPRSAIIGSSALILRLSELAEEHFFEAEDSSEEELLLSAETKCRDGRMFPIARTQNCGETAREIELGRGKRIKLSGDSIAYINKIRKLFERGDSCLFLSRLKETFAELEFMDSALPEVINKASLGKALTVMDSRPEIRKYLLNSLGYLALRYIPSVYTDGDGIGKLNIIISSLIILLLSFSENEAGAEGAVRAAVLFSKEIEYNEENTEILSEFI